MTSSRAENRATTFRSLSNTLLALLLFGLFVLLALPRPEALAQPTRNSTCLTGNCHVATSTTASLAWGIIYKGIKYPSSPTTLTVEAGTSFEVEWIATGMTYAASNTGMSFVVGLPSVTPTAWSISSGTATNAGITGWNTVWDSVGGWNWRTGTVLDTSATWPSSPIGYNIDYSGSPLWGASSGAAYDDGSTTTPGDKDGVADKMGTDVVINVPATTPAGTYTIYVAGVGHYYTTKSTKANKSQAITITVTAPNSDSTKPVVSAGFAATTPSASKTITVSGFAATDNTGVTGYMITTSTTAPLSTDAGWLATAPASYTVAADGSYTLYPWAKDAAGNVSAVYGAPVAVVVDSTKPVVSAGFAATTPSLSRTIAVSGFAATDARGVTGYMITTSATAPLATDAGWNATAPASYAVATDGSFTLYPWAKDAAGNVSAVYGSPVTVLVDTVRPAVTSSVPNTGATGITPDSTVTLNFSENVNCATVTTSSVTISPVVTWARTSCSGSQAVFTPTGQTGSTTYTVTAGTGVTDSAGNAMASSYPFSYTTAAPIVRPDTAISAPAAAAVLTGSPVAITGSATAGTNAIGSVQVSTNNGSTWSAATGTASWSYSWTLPSEDYVSHTVLAKAVDSAANEDTTPASVTVIVDTVAPAGLANSAPANLATNQALTTSLSSGVATDANVSGAVQYFFELATDSGFTTGVQQSGWQTTRTFAPTLAGGTTYYWHVRAKDAAGNTGAYTTTWSFTTIAPTAPNAPSASQYQADGSTAIAQAGTATSTSVVIKSTVTDVNGDNVTLQVEMITNANTFSGTANCSSVAVASGSTASATCSGLTDGLAYKWRARTTDGTLSSSWVDFGASNPDFTVTVPNTTPAAPTALAQYQADGTTAIATGGTASSNVVVIGATVDGGNSDPVLLEVDLNNDGIADCASPYVTGPATAKATCNGLADGSYDWRVRAKDSKAVASAWTAFTGTPDFTVATGLDFGVDTTPPADGIASASSGDGYISISWTQATDAGAGLDPVNSYKLVKSNVSSPADCSAAALYTGNGTSYFDTAVVNGTTYYYRVCAVDEVGNLSAGVTVSGSPSTIALPDTTISTPVANAVITTGPVSITGTASAGANPLASVQVSTNNGTTWAAATGTTAWSFTWAPSTEDYVAHTILAKGVDSLGYADATPAQVTVRVDNVAPAGLNNSAPANLATAVALNASLTSTAATDGNTSAAVQYFFEIATNSGFTTGVQQSTWQTGTTFTPTLAPGTQYFWHVKAKDAAGNSTAYTTTWSFTTGVVAPETVLSAPTAGTVFSTSPATISGTASAGTNPLGSVQVSVNNGTSWNTATGTGSWSYSWTLPAEDYVAHTILARAVDNAANADPTPASVAVYVDTVAPTGFANSTPANLATSVAATTSLTTTAATDANITASVQYFFEIATNSGFTTGVQQSTWQTGLSFAPTLAYGTTYYWHVRTRDAAGNISTYSTTTSFTTAAAVTTVGQGTGEISLTIPPGATEMDLDTFTLATQAGTDTVTGITVTLANGTWAGIATLNVTDDTGTTIYGSANPASNTVAITLTTPITVTTTPTQYVLVIDAKTATSMPAPPGATYAVTGTVTAITCSNPKAYNDTASATVTIDNLSPANVTAAGGAAGIASNSLYWTNPADSDFAGIVVLRKAGSAVTDTPVEGGNYLTGNIIGSSTVAYAGSLNNFIDAPLTNGTVYYYKIFALDSRGNYSATGVAVGPYTPVRTAWANSPMLHTSTTTGSTKWSANGGWGEPGKKYGGFSCSTCHNMSTANIMRIATSVATGDGSNWATNNSPTIAVSYLNPATDKGNDSTHATSNRICEVCHSATNFHKYNNAAANHNGTVNCTQCHSHNAGFKGSGGSCLLCHNSPRGVRQQVVGATLGTTGDDFVRPSRHIKNTTVKNVDCIICHAEGDTTSTETSVKQVSLHGTSGAPILLRNVDSQANPGTAGTNYWSWPGRRAGGTTITSADRDNMDRFCVNCHDSDGASTITVDTAGTAITTGTALARKLTPFNPLDGGSPLNVKSQFNSGNAVGSAYASHHNLNIYTKRYTATYASTYASRGGWTGTSKDGAAMTWDTGLHCSDCHLNESNAHGARNATRMLQDKNGADAAASNTNDGTATFVCYRCHLSTVYNYSNVTVTGKARIEHSSFDNVPWGPGTYNDHGIVCLNCHMGGGVNNIGGIHGNNRSITTLTQGATKSYRFIYGGQLGLNISEANWATTTAPSCYTASSTWGGACNKHDSSAGTGRIGTPNYARPLQ
ncbi:Ig-like domain-containing protein [Geomonas anaerohicana]|uniref:Ig-like domain-containing protein n=1 Tax=Geomonas anaerohicana TaxID=2798583 RepID=UPI001F22AAD7|nr:Ig-like domain-containing protein [Geomonas anaerohicana]